MNQIPYLKTENNRTTLMVDGAPFLILGGELHNSSGSDLSYMEEHVWPGLRRLGGNCYLTPVYWECLEPEQGEYCFDLVDGVIAQARREGVRLVLLWFGLWKNGGSSYAPAWVKQNREYFYMQGQDGLCIESVSPLCTGAVEADAAAFSALMTHLRDTDTERTVIMVQVENEVGVWGHPRDYSPAAEAVFRDRIPGEMAELYGVSGTWEEAFGLNACEYFMAWALSTAVGRIAARGKACYPLPQFMNCVPSGMGVSQLAGSCPSGGPVARVNKIWRAMAPAIDLYGPDIYASNFREISSEFAALNALVIPELGGGIDTASKAMFSAAAYNLVCFSPFGIDGMMEPISAHDLVAQMGMAMPPRPMVPAGELLAEAYRLIRALWPQICTAQQQENAFAFLQQSDFGHEFVLDDYIIDISYGGGRPGPGAVPQPRREDTPMGGGFILRLGRDHFLLCGCSCFVKIKPRYASRDQLFVLDKRELHLTECGFVPGRILNGDERNHLALGPAPAVQELKFYRR